MKKNTFYITTLVLMFTTFCYSQDVSNFYTPYGFRLPNLNQGEYILSGWGNYYSSEYSLNYNSPHEFYNSDYSNFNLNLRSVYALTNQILFRLNLSYYPEQIIRDSDSDDYKQETTMESHIAPDIMIVFKPISSLEIYGTYYYQNIKDNDKFIPESFFGYKGSKDKNERISFGFNYYGKL